MPANDKKVKATNGYRLPERLPKGEILNGILGEKWEIGDVIGSGGFGVIYLARSLSSDSSANNHVTKSNGRTTKSKSTAKFNYVIKLDHASGPLFAEMHFYSRVAKKQLIENWLKEKGLKSIGLPEYISSGMYNYASAKASKSKKPEDSRYRFLVMPRFGMDLQKVLDLVESGLSLKTAYTIGIKVLQVLEYVHSFGYIHADIKASNLLLSADIDDPMNAVHEQIWLVDYGLADRFYSNDKHREYCEDKRKENNGTVEFLARDSHVGAFSRKNDMEILAYNLLSWVSGARLPWMSNLEDYNYVKESKKYYMEKLHELFNYAFQSSNACDNSPKENKNGRNNYRTTKKNSKTSSNIDYNKLTANVPPGLIEFFQAVINLEFTEQPDYSYFQGLLRDAIESTGHIYTGTFEFKDTPTSRRSSRASIKRPVEQLAELSIEPIQKISTNTENGIAKTRLRRNNQVVQKSEPDVPQTYNVDQLQIMDSIRKKRGNGLCSESQPVLRPKRKNTENQIEPRQNGLLSNASDLEPIKNGKAIPKTTRTLRSNSKIKQLKDSGIANDILNGKSHLISNDVSKDPNNVKKNPTPAMLEILRKLNEKKKT